MQDASKYVQCGDCGKLFKSAAGYKSHTSKGSGAKRQPCCFDLSKLTAQEIKEYNVNRRIATKLAYKC